MGAHALEQFRIQADFAFGVEAAQQALRQRLEIGALAQRRKLHGQAIDAVVEVAAKQPLFGGFAQPRVGGADQREIHGDRPAAERRHAALLQHAQQPRLHAQRHVANFVEEQRPALRLAQAPEAALAPRAGEGAAGVAEQLCLDQVLRNGGAVDRHERPRAARTAVVRRAGKELLAHARFTLEQDRDRFVQNAPGLFRGAAPTQVARVQAGECVAGLCRRRQRLGRSLRQCDLFAMQLRVQRDTVAPAHLKDRLPVAPVAQPEVFGAQVQAIGQGRATQACGRQAQQRKARAIRAHDAAVVRYGDDALGHCAKAFDLRMQVQAQLVPTAGGDEAVLDHARGRADQAQRMRMPAAVVSRNVEYAQQRAGRRHDGRGCTGEETVAIEEVLTAVDLDAADFGQRRADGVGSTVPFVPRDATRERNALGLVQKIGVSQPVHQRAAFIREDHDALAVAHLLEQELHHGPGMREQVLVDRQRVAQFRAAERAGIVEPAHRQQAGGHAALPGAGQACVHLAGRAVAVLQQLQPGLTQCHGGQGSMHGVSLTDGLCSVVSKTQAMVTNKRDCRDMKWLA